MLQLQQIQTHGKKMLIKKERKQNQEMFQMQEKRTYCQGLQRNTVNEKITTLGRIR